jgi:hypothetical protein
MLNQMKKYINDIICFMIILLFSYIIKNVYKLSYSLTFFIFLFLYGYVYTYLNKDYLNQKYIFKN